MNLKENYILSSQVKFFNTPSPDWFRGPWYHDTMVPGYQERFSLSWDVRKKSVSTQYSSNIRGIGGVVFKQWNYYNFKVLTPEPDSNQNKVRLYDVRSKR